MSIWHIAQYYGDLYIRRYSSWSTWSSQDEIRFAGPYAADASRCISKSFCIFRSHVPWAASRHFVWPRKRNPSLGRSASYPTYILLYRTLHLCRHILGKTSKGLPSVVIVYQSLHLGNCFEITTIDMPILLIPGLFVFLCSAILQFMHNLSAFPPGTKPLLIVNLTLKTIFHYDFI